MLTFMLLLSYVIISALNEKATSETEEESSSVTVRNNTNGSSSTRDLEKLKCEIKEYCAVTCTGFVVGDNINNHINRATENVTISSNNGYEVINSTILGYMSTNIPSYDSQVHIYKSFY